MKSFVFTFYAALICSLVVAQNRPVVRAGGGGNEDPQIQYDRNGRPIRKTPGNDSLQKRDRFKDSITIFYNYFDSTRLRSLDTTINDFNNKFPIPYTHQHLGNLGGATRNLVFKPNMRAGFDAGFHQFDVYKYTIEGAKFFQTTRPYTELGYMLGSKAEQQIELIHTQNRGQNFNIAIEYRFINSPGNLRLQNASQNNMRITSQYRSNNKRYGLYFIYATNKSAASENGGLQDINAIRDVALNNPFDLLTRIGSPTVVRRNPFNTKVSIGNIYQDQSLVIRQQYDFGQKKSIMMEDSSMATIFYPRFRLEHTLRYTQSQFQFFDEAYIDTLYNKYLGYQHPGVVTQIQFQDAWRDLKNELAIITYPNKNNQSQFLRLGAGWQQVRGRFDTGFTQLRTTQFDNLYALGEYRNRTKNQKWDLELAANLFITGFHAGDYQVSGSIFRKLSQRAGSLRLGTANVNRTPSFIFDRVSAFPVRRTGTFNQENTLHLYAEYSNEAANWSIKGDYYAVSNFMYFDSFFSPKQEATLFNMLHISAEKKFRLNKRWNWYTEIHVQQATSGAPVNVPLVLTRNRIAYEGNFYTNLFLSTGLEIRYHTPFKADQYSPMLGQFFLQNTFTLNNRPDIALFFHARIKRLKAFVRLENLNSLNLSQGFVFNNYNFGAENYAYPGMWFRLGLWWNFVN